MSQRFVLIGHPVGHSISPAIHRRAYGLLGISAEYTLRDCAEEEKVRAVVDEIRKGELDGANVTVPWKQLAFDLADLHDPTARDVGVANVLARNRDGEIVAHNTDASALGRELRKAADHAKVDREGKPAAVVMGNGGAALAAVVGCHLAGISDVFVCARSFDAAVLPDSWPRHEQFQALGAHLIPWPTFDRQAWDTSLAKSHLLIQATTAGMKGASDGKSLAELVPWSQLGGLVAYDLVYNPPVTPFLAAAGSAGVHAVGGLGMLVGQAALAIEIWLGRSPELAPLEQTARETLGL